MHRVWFIGAGALLLIALLASFFVKPDEPRYTPPPVRPAATPAIQALGEINTDGAVDVVMVWGTASPRPNDAALTGLRDGDRVDILVDGPMVRIRTRDGTEGYVAARYVRVFR